MRAELVVGSKNGFFVEGVLGSDVQVGELGGADACCHVAVDAGGVEGVSEAGCVADGEPVFSCYFGGAEGEAFANEPVVESAYLPGTSRLKYST